MPRGTMSFRSAGDPPPNDEGRERASDRGSSELEAARQPRARMGAKLTGFGMTSASSGGLSAGAIAAGTPAGTRSAGGTSQRLGPYRGVAMDTAPGICSAGELDPDVELDSGAGICSAGGTSQRLGPYRGIGRNAGVSHGT